MKQFLYAICLTTFGFIAASDNDGTCKKCQLLRKYHEDNPCPYEYYEDYLKALEEKRELPKEIKPEELIKKDEEKKPLKSHEMPK